MMHCAFLLFFIGIVANQRSIRATPLDDYVNKPDPTYAWNLVSTTPTDKSTVYILNLTSQTWMDRKTTIDISTKKSIQISFQKHFHLGQFGDTIWL